MAGRRRKRGLTLSFRALLSDLAEDLRRLDERIRELHAQIAQQAKADPLARRLQELRGVGPLVATALTVALGDGQTPLPEGETSRPRWG